MGFVSEFVLRVFLRDTQYARRNTKGNGENAMEGIRLKAIIGIMICMTMLSINLMSVIACPPDPPDCYDDGDCYGCESCVDGECTNNCDTETESCCDNIICYDYDTKQCCGYENGKTCNNDETCCEEYCCNNECETCCEDKCCDTSNCEVCVLEENNTCKQLELKSETWVTIPEDRTRTTIGIGEAVLCYTDPPVSVEWSVSGDGFVSPTQNPYTWYFAIKSPGSGTVKAKFGTCGCEKTKTFTVIAPNGMTVSLDQDYSLGTLGPPNNNIGCSSKFLCVVLSTSVNFYAVSFQENIPGDTWIWPDGTPDSFSSRIVSWSVGTINGQHNATTDVSTEPLKPIIRLWNDSNYIDHSHTIRVPEEYLNQNNVWTSWLSGEVHPKQYRGSDQAGRTYIQASNTAYGNWMGPWQ